MRMKLLLLLLSLLLIENNAKLLNFLSSILHNNPNNDSDFNKGKIKLGSYFNLSLNMLNFGYYDDRSHESKISSNDLKQVLNKCLNMMNMSKTNIILSGWKLVHHNHNENFMLYKKKIKEKGYRVVYLMIGEFKDISGRTFLKVQFDPILR